MSDNSNTGLTFGVDANVHNSFEFGQGQPLLLQKDFAGLSSQQLLTLAGEGIIEAWQNKTDPTQALVYAFAGIFGINFEANAQIAFGENFDIQKAKALGNDILGGNHGVLPDFQFTHSSEFNGAYAESLNTVYIDSVFVSQNAANPNAVGKVLVEELGHSIDAFASPVDSIGDEGKILEKLVSGEKLSSAELTSLKTEDDHNVLNIGGQQVAVEMDAVSGTANTLQTAKNIGVLGSASQPFTGFVGDSGINNYIKFQVTTPSVFAVELSGLAKNANVRLLDAQGNFIQASYNQGIAIDSFQHSLGVGTYYVHVYREAAGDNTNYTLKLSASSVTYPVDTAGNTIATAGKLGVLNGLQPFKEFVSLANDPLDLFEFKLTEYSNFKVSFAGMTAPISVKLLDASQNILQSFDPSTPQSFEIFKNLGAGTYYLAVASKGADTAYTFTTSAYGDVERYIDFSQTTSSNEVHTRTGWVGDMDVHDFIPFSIVKGGYVKLDLNGLTGNVSLRLLYYPEGQYESVPLVNNGQYIDPAFVSKLIPVGASYNLGSQSESIYLNLDKVGKYFIHVYAETLQEKTPYTLRASFITDDAGNTPQTARLLQIPLNSSLSVSDRVHDGDTQDYYKVVLNGTSDVRFALQGKSADVNLKIFDQNLKFVQASYNPGLAEDVITLNNLAAGTYYALAYQEKLGTDTEYTLQTSITGKAPVVSGGSTTIITQPPAVTPQWKIQYFNGNSPNGTPVYTEAMGNPQNGSNKLNFAFYWGENAPNSSVSKDNFSARVTGSSNLEAGEYRITVSADDGIRVRANQQTIIDKWFDQSISSVYTGTFITNGGNVPIEVDYYEKAGYAGLQFFLERIGNVPATAISTPTTTNPISNPTKIEFDVVAGVSVSNINGYTISGALSPVYKQYQSTLGQPISSVNSYSNNISYQYFANGSIVSSQYGTFALYGAIRQQYKTLGGLDSWLGAPKSNETGLGNGLIRQDFVGGYIVWNGSSAVAKPKDGTSINSPVGDFNDGTNGYGSGYKKISLAQLTTNYNYLGSGSSLDAINDWTNFQLPIDKTYRSPNYELRPINSSIDMIVYHHTGNQYNTAVTKFMNQFPYQNNNLSAHYVIDTDGTVYEMVNPDNKAYHAGGKYNDIEFNNRSIGIEIVNADGNLHPYYQEQYRSLELLTLDLLKRYPSIKFLTGHQDIDQLRGANSNGKTDPGKLFDWNEIKIAADHAPDSSSVIRYIGNSNLSKLLV